jgi:hypothetical protein
MRIQHWIRTHLTVTHPFLTTYLHQLPKNMETQRIYMNGLIQQLVTPTLGKEKEKS